MKPGSATNFYGIKPVLVDKDGKLIKEREKAGYAWRNLGQVKCERYGDHQRFIDTYFSQVDGNILQMDVEEIKMDTTGSQEE